jgi:hypothetical protein
VCRAFLYKAKHSYTASLSAGLCIILCNVEDMQVPIYARAQDLDHLLELKQAGTTDSLLENAEV